MSHTSAELAAIYSDAKVVSTELKGWLGEVEMDESVARAQLERLVDDHADVLPALGLEVISQKPDSKINHCPMRLNKHFVLV